MKNQLFYTVFPIYAIGLFFNAIFSIASIVIPLYGLSAGYSATQIGILISMPGAFQVTLRMFSGILSDRFGEKKMLALTHVLTILACTAFAFKLSFLSLAIFQVIIGVARGIFWPTSQSYASRISKDKSSTIIGRFHSFNEIGKISGMLCAGWAVLNIGYLSTFRLVAVIGLLGLIANLIMKSIPLATGERKKVNVSDSFQNLLKKPPLLLAFITAFCAGLLLALTQTFFPVWLKTLGTSEGIISLAITVYLVGSLLAGRVFANILGKLQFPSLLQISLGVVGAGFLLISFVKGLVPVFALILILGFFGGFITVSYQVMVVNNSLESNRGAIYSFVGTGWAIAFMVGPTLFGMLVDGVTVTVAFTCLGLVIFLYAVFIKTIYSRFVNAYQKKDNVSA